MLHAATFDQLLVEVATVHTHPHVLFSFFAHVKYEYEQHVNQAELE